MRKGGRKERRGNCYKNTIWTNFSDLCLHVVMGGTHMTGSVGRESCADKGCIHQ